MAQWNAMERNELSERWVSVAVDDQWSINDELRQSDERIEASLRRLAEFNRRLAVKTDAFIAKAEVAREESRAFRQTLRERLAGLPPAQAG